MKMLVLINPISGTGKQKGVAELIKKTLDADRFEIEIRETEYAGHAILLAKEASQNGFDIVVAVGGDGTVNEVAQGLLFSQSSLAIIPCGSGNGFARHLGISCNPKKAIHQLNESVSASVDTLQINDFISINVSGIGYDSYISHIFAKMDSRGLSSYVKAIWSTYFSYKDRKYTLHIDGEKQNFDAFMVSFANSSQFGNNAFIDPNASLQDGIFTVNVIKKPHLYEVPYLLFALFAKKLPSTRIYQSFRCKECLIIQPENMLHVDGEPVVSDKELSIQLKNNSLKVMIPKNKVGVI
ncbi:YegS/Rv2252/BmrU family lipid kinase [Halosquirtibacter laminarini]|uniref:YegS/Rv2252/BmrU family lipid kinase n=1 Tax=Halosquirtibacter laminarini TaxID=3374600 RepID=A0AC61NEN5_9BACT|nr:YegS/Rv2252/BmrU family lipid kinase [Prolixibacteraceae bacterium]